MKSLLVVLFLLTPYLSFTQPGDPYIGFNFRFFDEHGNVVTPQTKGYEIKIDFTSPLYRGTDSVIFCNEYFTGASLIGAVIDIHFVSENDTMRILTPISLDSIPFLKGNFVIPIEYASLLLIKTHEEVNIDKKNWNIFKVKNLTDTIRYPDTLKKIDCKFWKDYKQKIPIDFTPSIAGILFNPDFSSKIYAWDHENLYVSMDEGRNWENILTLHEIISISFKDKRTLLLFKNEIFRPTNLKPLVYSLKNERTLKPEPTYTNMGFYYVGLNKKKRGFAYAVKYFPEKRSSKTVFHISKDGGKNWEETSSVNNIFYPGSISYWNNDTIIVNTDYGWNYNSFDGGKTWNFLIPEYRYYKVFGNIYPSFESSEYVHCLEKVDSENKISTRLLTVNKDWYAQMTATKNIWSVSGSSYTLISKDNGKNWKYYYGGTAGRFIFTIINDKYIFDGNSLFEIN